MDYERGDVVLVSLPPVVGSEQADIRPGIVVSNELFHRLGIVTVVAVTSRMKSFPGRISIQPDEGNGLTQPSDVLAYQIRTLSIEPQRVLKKLGRLSHHDLQSVDEALKLTLKLS